MHNDSVLEVCGNNLIPKPLMVSYIPRYRFLSPFRKNPPFRFLTVFETVLLAGPGIPDFFLVIAVRVRGPLVAFASIFRLQLITRR